MHVMTYDTSFIYCKNKIKFHQTNEVSQVMFIILILLTKKKKNKTNFK